MKCSHIEKLLSGYLDGDLGEEESTLVSEHLKICSKCSQELDSLKETISLLKTKESVEPPQDFVVRVRKKIESRRWWKKAVKLIFYPWHIKIPAEAIATVIIVCLLYYIYHQPVQLRPVQRIEEKTIPTDEFAYRAEIPAPPMERKVEYFKKEQALEVRGFAERPISGIGIQKDKLTLDMDTYGISDLARVAETEHKVPDLLEEEVSLVQKELILTLKEPKEDLLEIKKYLSSLNAEIEESSDELTRERIISFQIQRKDYTELVKKLVQMDAIEPQEIKEMLEEYIAVKLRIR